MIFLRKYIRYIVMIVTFIWGASVYFYSANTTVTDTALVQKLVKIYALTGVTYLYLALLASPLYSAFPNLPFKYIHLIARRAIGVSGFLFAATHASLAFFNLLGGFSGLSYLGSSYLIPITLGATALTILGLMASTSWDYAVKKLGRWWKRLHRFFYLAATLIVVHALMLGSDFTDLSETIPKIFFIALSILLVLEALRFDKWLATKLNIQSKFGISILLVVGGLVWASFYLVPPEQGTTSLGIHSQHIKLAQEAQKGNQTDLPAVPGLDGDRTKRYTLDIDSPDIINPGRAVELRFRVFDASNGGSVVSFKTPYRELFHLIIVDSELKYFAHVHPKQVGNEFMINHRFPKNSLYHLYADFQPLGAIEQQLAFTVKVGSTGDTKAIQPIDKNLTKVFGDYEVTLSSESLSAEKMSIGQQKLTFNIKDSRTKEPITDLKPYLNSFGHLVMINQATYDYLHVHPYNLNVPAPNESGGPNVEFLPVGIYGKFKQGIYRAFGQFNHDGKLFVADFTLEVGK